MKPKFHSIEHSIINTYDGVDTRCNSDDFKLDTPASRHLSTLQQGESDYKLQQ